AAGVAPLVPAVPAAAVAAPVVPVGGAVGAGGGAGQGGASPAADSEISALVQRMASRLEKLEDEVINVQERQDWRGPELALGERQRIEEQLPMISEQALVEMRDRKLSRQDQTFMADYNRIMTLARRAETLRVNVAQGGIETKADIDKAMKP